VSAIAASSTSNYLHSHASLTPGAALDHGFQTALYALTGLLIVGALISAALLKSTPARGEPERVEPEAVVLEEAA
jgi:hypothetical protein